MPKRRRTNSAARAFTLVELLVVIAVIAVLSSIALPALSGAKASGQATVCKNRVRNWTLAMKNYAEDNDQVLATESATSPITDLDNWYEVKDSSRPWYNSLAADYVSTPGAADYFYTPLEFHSRALPFHCPVAKFPKGALQNLYAHFSIAMNSQLCEPPHPTVSVTSLEQYRTSDVVLFTEGRLPDEPPADSMLAFSWALGQPAVHINRIAVRHKHRAHVGMLDGSVHLRTFKQLNSDGILWEPR